MKLLLATSNLGKIQEMHEALGDIGLLLRTLADLPDLPLPKETGVTFAENAALKARHYFPHAGHDTVADDSGVVVNALEGELGIHTRRWGAGTQATDEEWIEHFLKRMRKEKNKRAHFVCSLAYVDATGSLHLFEAACDGMITEKLEAHYLPGLPISACFRPDGFDRVFSALSIEQKNSTSHRGRALKKFSDFLGKKKKLSP